MINFNYKFDTYIIKVILNTIMFLGFFIIILGLGFLMLLEKKYPDQELKKVPGWWQRVLFINASQLIITIIGMYTWEVWLQTTPIFNLKEYVNPAMGGLLAYLINTWIFYWWHLARHEIYLFWILFHQMHHSAQRIEAITSFYKHPLEILADSVVVVILLYPILGLSMDSSIWMLAFSAYGEFFYHMNIKTPKWIGYIFQRPESHRVHHLRNKRTYCDNYSDCPWWDMLNGTFSNPEVMNDPTGFKTEKETQFWEMFVFQDVLLNHNKYRKVLKVPSKITLLSLILLIIGCLQPFGYLFNQPQIRGLGIVSVASPLPLVFSSYGGIETFSTEFVLNINISNGFDKNSYQSESIPMTQELYNNIKGPYNRRNAYGVVFSHGPFFNTSELINLRQQVLDYAICHNGLDLDYYNIFRDKKYQFNPKMIQNVEILITSKTNGYENQSWYMNVQC